MFKEKVVNYFGVHPEKKDVGIEIEMEFDSPQLFPPQVLDKWLLDNDHSLKNYGYELVIREPIAFKSVEGVIKRVEKYIEKPDLMSTIRAGVHIHLNMQDRTIKQLYQFLALYYSLETVLTRFCGEGREGNLFCLRARDAELIQSTLCLSVEQEDFHHFNSDQFRYSALNLKSLFSYGTVEFRAMRTPRDFSRIVEWVEIIQRLKEASKKVDLVWDIPNQISANGPKFWVQDILGKDLLAKLDYPELEQDVMFDMQNSQLFLHLLKMKGV